MWPPEMHEAMLWYTLTNLLLFAVIVVIVYRFHFAPWRRGHIERLARLNEFQEEVEEHKRTEYNLQGQPTFPFHYEEWAQWRGEGPAPASWHAINPKTGEQTKIYRSYADYCWD